jgi:hypothetical protein
MLKTLFNQFSHRLVYNLMCTVTYYPFSADHFLFATNRDEAPKRAAQELIRKKITNGKTLLYPRDTGANGTWVAISDADQLVCILNGGRVKHRHEPPYRLSRGIMALDFFDHQDITAFTSNYDFSGIEPFTMVIYDNKRLVTLYWDEVTLEVQELDPMVRQLWSSCTLYLPALQSKRKRWFFDWAMLTNNPTRADLLAFHWTGGSGDPENDLVMNRHNVVRTTSITSLEKTPKVFDLHLFQVMNKTAEQYSLRIAGGNKLTSTPPTGLPNPSGS